MLFHIMVSKRDPYVQLIKSFIENRIDVNEFERRYLAMFTNDTSAAASTEFITYL